MKKTGKNVEDERSKGRGSAPASGHPKVKSCSILLAMVMIFMLSVSLPAYATNATGGTVTYSGNYKIHTFTGSGTLNVTESGNVEYLVVGGGGGGQSAWGWGDGSGGGSGGGAGGYRSGTLSTTSKSYTITVGNGGGSDQKGGDSIFDTITATGGGSGSGGSGGSGGGGGGSGNTPSTSPSQGNNGGARSGKQGGGGGGIGAVGQNALAGNYGGAGGAGVYNSITGSSVGYAGGGGGGTACDVSGGTPNTGSASHGGGGGGYAQGVPPASGTTNRGGGGGGGGYRNSESPTGGGSGGSGIVIVRYTLPQFTITASSGANGSITPSGVTTVNQGASQNYTITPATGYKVTDVLVDGVSVGAVNTYNFTDVSATHTISATFGVTTYTITASSGTNGLVSPTGVTSVTHGALQTYIITPATNYSIADVLVDGVSVGAVSTYEFTDITVNHTISATFGIVTHTITASAGENGSITPSGAITVNQGTSQNYAITPSTGYQVADVLVDGVSVGAASTYTFNNVAVSHTISATFTYQLPTINSVSCPASLYTGQAGTCTVSASAAAGTLKYAWTVPGGSAETPTDASTSVTFTTAGVKTVSVKAYIDEDVSVFATSSKTLTINGSDLTLSVNCPEAGSESQVLSCTAAGSSNWGEIAFLWNTDAGGNIVGANNTATATVAFSTGGNHSARVKMYLVEAPFLFIEKVANITVVVPPTIYNVGCNEDVYLGQPVNCFVSAGTLGGTLKLRWNAVDGQISDLSASATDIIFDTPGVKTVTVKASIMESPSIETNRQIQVNVLDNPITADVTCPEEVISNETFTCTVQGNTPPWGTLAFDWLEGSSNKPVANGGSVNITANRDGTMLVRLVASLIESSTRRIEVKKTVKVIGEKNVIPVVTGARTVYIDAENTYKATAPCLTSAKCTVKWRHNGEETAGDTLNIIFTAPGKYELEVETILAGTESVRTIKHVVNAVDFPRIPVSISGQKAVWVGEEYTYTAVIPLKFSGLNILTRWTLPDNSTVDGRQVTMTPTAEGTYSLKCEGWVNGHRDATLKTVQYKITAVGYSFPTPKINVKKTEGLGPYNVTFKIDYTVKKIMGLQYRITYNWNFGDGETLTTTNTVVHHLFSRVGTYNVTMTATDQYDNTTMDNVTITVGAAPIGIGFKVSASNKYMRAPLEIYVRSAISKKMPLDSLESYVWKVDGVAAENTKSEYLRATFSEPGDHTVTYTATMKSGATATDSVDITVNPNQPPTCTIDHTLGVGSYVYLKAKCTDPDGRISAYKWDLDDDRGYRKGSANISFKAPVTHTYSIGLKATDDSGEEAEFTKEITVTKE